MLSSLTSKSTQISFHFSPLPPLLTPLVQASYLTHPLTCCFLHPLPGFLLWLWLPRSLLPAGPEWFSAQNLRCLLALSVNTEVPPVVSEAFPARSPSHYLASCPSFSCPSGHTDLLAGQASSSLGFWHPLLPLFAMLFRYPNGWRPSYLPYLDVTFSVWPSLTALDNCSLPHPQYTPPTLLSALVFFRAFIAIWPTAGVLCVFSPPVRGRHKEKHFLSILFIPLNPGHST